MKNKRGDSQLYYTVIFLVVILIFGGSILYFVNNSSKGSLVYEQTYSKEIALVLDKSKPNTHISINFEEPLKIAGKNNFNKEQIVQISNGEVIVKLEDNGGYKMKYFSDYLVESKIEGNNLILEVRENA